MRPSSATAYLRGLPGDEPRKSVERMVLRLRGHRPAGGPGPTGVSLAAARGVSAHVPWGRVRTAGRTSEVLRGPGALVAPMPPYKPPKIRRAMGQGSLESARLRPPGGIAAAGLGASGRFAGGRRRPECRGLGSAVSLRARWKVVFRLLPGRFGSVGGGTGASLWPGAGRPCPSAELRVGMLRSRCRMLRWAGRSDQPKELGRARDHALWVFRRLQLPWRPDRNPACLLPGRPAQVGRCRPPVPGRPQVGLRHATAIVDEWRRGWLPDDGIPFPGSALP